MQAASNVDAFTTEPTWQGSETHMQLIMNIPYRFDCDQDDKIWVCSCRLGCAFTSTLHQQSTNHFLNELQRLKGILEMTDAMKHPTRGRLFWPKHHFDTFTGLIQAMKQGKHHPSCLHPDRTTTGSKNRDPYDGFDMKSREWIAESKGQRCLDSDLNDMYVVKRLKLRK